MRAGSIVLLVTGIALLLSAFLWPVSIREEQGFMDAAQRTSNVMETGDAEPSSPSVAYKEAMSRVADEAGLLRRDTIMGASGGLLIVIGLLLSGLDYLWIGRARMATDKG